MTQSNKRITIRDYSELQLLKTLYGQINCKKCGKETVVGSNIVKHSNKGSTSLGRHKDSSNSKPFIYCIQCWNSLQQ